MSPTLPTYDVPAARLEPISSALFVSVVGLGSDGQINALITVWRTVEFCWPSDIVVFQPALFVPHMKSKLTALNSAFCSICGTFLTAICAMLLFRPPLPSAESLRQTEWWNWVGGPLGAVIVLAGASLVSDLGAALFIALVVGGQLVCSLLLDHFGLMGLPVQSLSPGRVLGAALVVAGVVCIKYL